MGGPRRECSCVCVYKAYTAEKDASTSEMLSRAFADDPIMKTLYPGHEWDKIGIFLFSWYLWMFHGAYSMCDVAEDAASGRVMCAALWEPAKMSIGGALRGMVLAFAFLYKQGWAATKRGAKVLLESEEIRHKLAP